MHRRNSTNPRRLDRRKSATSVKSVHLEHILPETAERDAQVAATQAFARAKARSATDTNSSLWPPPRYGGQSDSTQDCHLHLKTRSEETPFGRQQSIRFVQSRPPTLAQNTTMARGTSPSCASHTSKYAADTEVDLQSPSSFYASGIVSAAKGAAGDYINTLFTNDEHYTPQDDIASMPSSYRKLRKSRSMFTNRAIVAGPEHPDFSKSSASANQLPLPANSYSRPPRGNENIPPRRLKTPKSMSFLRDLRGTFVPNFKSEEDTTQFVSTNEHNRNQDRPNHTLRPKASKIFSSKTPKTDRVFRKSMRDISNDTVWMDNEAAKDGSLRYKARRVSQGLKHKLKNLFSLGKGDTDNTGLPLQHVDAHKSHIFGFGDSQQEADDELLRMSSVDQAALSHVTSGTPHLHAVPSYQQVRSRQGSMESLQSDQKASDDRSRVTSWSNSDTNTVITHNSCRDERERKRLSIINEHGAHVCSSSAQFQTISEQSNASSASLQEPSQAVPGAVDGRRIYSALMKRMDQSRQRLTNSLETQSNEDEVVQLGKVPRRKSSLRLRRLGHNAPATIRYVMPESESEPGSPKASNVSYRKDEHMPSSTYNSNSAQQKPNTSKAEQERQVYPASTSTFTDAEHVSSTKTDNEIFSAPPIKETMQTLSSRSSAFFGSPTRHLFRTQSPYRRVLQDKMVIAPNEQPIKSPDFNPWLRSLSNLPNLQLQRSSTYGSDADIKLHYTESIYSTNTEDGQTRRESFLSVIEDFPRPKSTHGDATIFVDQPAYDKRSSSLPPKQRVTSSSSSVEWKMWLSSNVSKLEETTKQVDSNDFQCGLRSARSSGHVRENAQINDEEEDDSPDQPKTPSRIRVDKNHFLDLNHDDDDDDDDEEGDDQPTPFDAGATGHSRLPSVNPSPTCVSATSRASTEVFNTSREKELPRVPSLGFKDNRTNRLASIPTKLAKHLPKRKTSMEPLTSRGIPGMGDTQPTKLNSSTHFPRKVYSMASIKPENVSPTAASDDDPYGIEGSGILGPDQQSVGSKRMVDIFLSSRRRRMTSEDESSVFL
ncbi:hypothetical protein EV127DRAFT_497778 [Xylaria flabelliformis]|nr:hypothetical protein EV127DRAFT_497778 [Xylaria flabelliformis]